MNIGIVANVKGHISRFWVGIADALELEGHRVFFLAAGELDDRRFTSSRGLSRRPSIRNLLAPSDLKAWIARNQIDVVVTNTATPSFLVRFSRLPVPVIYFAHGLHWAEEFGVKYRIWSTIERLALNKSSGMIVLNNEDAGWVARHGFRGPLLRLRYGVGLSLDRFDHHELPEGSKAVWIGEFSRRKQPLHAVRAAQLIAKELPDFRLAMLGRGALRDQAVSLAEELGISDVVSFPGHVDPQPYLVESTVLLHCAQWEGLPRVALEALATGRPVSALNAKGLRDVPGIMTTREKSVEELATQTVAILRRPSAYLTAESRQLLSSAHSADLISKFLMQVADYRI